MNDSKALRYIASRLIEDYNQAQRQLIVASTYQEQEQLFIRLNTLNDYIRLLCSVSKIKIYCDYGASGTWEYYLLPDFPKEISENKLTKNSIYGIMNYHSKSEIKTRSKANEKNRTKNTN